MAGVGGVELFIGLLFMAIPLFLLFFVIKWAVASAMKDVRSSNGSKTRTAKEILDERYARGEIGREEYEGMRHAIEG